MINKVDFNLQRNGLLFNWRQHQEHIGYNSGEIVGTNLYQRLSLSYCIGLNQRYQIYIQATPLQSGGD